MGFVCFSLWFIVNDDVDIKVWHTYIHPGLNYNTVTSLYSMTIICHIANNLFD